MPAESPREQRREEKAREKAREKIREQTRERRENRRTARRPGLDTPVDSRRTLRAPRVDKEAFGRGSEKFARFMGTAWFIVGMTVLVVAWLSWNTLMPVRLQFDPRDLNYTLLTLILSLQASYAAPLILLAQNRQADRDRVSFEQDRDRSERALADTEYLAREVASLRIALREVATRDFVRSELRSLLEELDSPRAERRDKREKKDKPRDRRDARRTPGGGHHAPTGDPFGSTPAVDVPTESG
jgi:uncharacterized membrane protein